MNLIDKLAKEDGKWRGMAQFITKDNDRADELVQEFYLKIHQKDIEGKINLWEKYDDFIFIMLKNMNYDLFIKDKSYNKEFNEEQDKVEDNSELINKEIFEEFYSNIENYMSQGYKIDKTMQYKIGLLKLNSLDGMSMQKISDLTGITKRSVQMSIESVRKQIKNKFEKEHKEYLKNLTDGN